MADNSAIRTHVRLDQLLVSRGLYDSRSRARDAIKRGTVIVDGQAASKPGHMVQTDCEVSVDDPARSYVSRAALKLLAGLDHFGFDPAGRSALDLGASTGGFTQVLLERGATHVCAIDVGRGQLDEAILSDDRVTAIEGLNARDLTIEHLGNNKPAIVVSDMSFISLKLALPPALRLAEPGALGLFLVKPQFEAGPQSVGKGGVLRDQNQAEFIADDLSDWLCAFSEWRSLGVCRSPISGGDGNREFVLGGVKDR